MIRGQTVVGVVIARGGSKGLPGKNLRRLGRHPLVAHTILVAKQAWTLDRVILSTDSPQIAKVGKRYGVEVPFLRPKYLARDTTHTPPVIEHAVSYLEKHEGMKVDIVVTLQPTSPFRRVEHINSAVRLLSTKRRLDSVITVKVVTLPPFWMFKARKHRLVPFVQNGIDYSVKERQELPTIYQPNGAVYATRRKLLRDQGLIFSTFSGGATGYVVMDPVTSLDIDGPMDFMMAEIVLKQNPDFY